MLQGFTSAFSVPDLFHLLRSKATSGVLRIGLKSEVIAFHFQFGGLVRACSDNPPPESRLGEILVLRGSLQRRALRSLLAQHTGVDGPLGRSLVRHQLVSREELRAALAEQYQRVIRRALAFVGVPFLFSAVEIAEPYDEMTFDVQHLLLEATRVSDEQAYLENLHERLRNYQARALGAQGCS